MKSWVAQPVRSVIAAARYRGVRIYGPVSIGPGCSFGEYVSIYRGSVLSGASFGDFTYVGGGSEIKNARIGKFCSIGPEVRIGLGIHPLDRISTYPGFYSTAASGAVRIGFDGAIEEFRVVEVGHDVWIGARAIIVDGVVIGNGAIVGAGAVVTKDVEPYAIVAGVPARFIRSRFSADEVAFLESFAWWNRGLDFCRAHSALFLKPQAFFEELGNKPSEFNGKDVDAR